MSSSNIINSVHSVHVTSLECDGKRVLVKISWDTHNNTVKIMRVSRSKTAAQAMARGDNGAGGVREGVGRRVLGGGGAGSKAGAHGEVGDGGQQGGHKKAWHGGAVGASCWFWVPY